jgi:hypothetical protein
MGFWEAGLDPIHRLSHYGVAELTIPTKTEDPNQS